MPAPREYLRFYPAIRDHDKWLGLSWAAQAAWVNLLALSAATEGVFESAEYLARWLSRQGCPAGDSVRVVGELIEIHLLDEETDGTVAMHNWRIHQPVYRGPSDAPEAKRARMAELRASRATPERRVRIVRPRATGSIEERRGDSPTPDGVGTREQSKPSPRQAALGALKALGYRTPSGWAAPIFAELVAKVEPARLAATFSAGKADGVTMTNKLIGYAERELSGSPKPTSNGHRPGATKPGEFAAEEATRATRV